MKTIQYHDNNIQVLEVEWGRAEEIVRWRYAEDVNETHQKCKG